MRKEEYSLEETTLKGNLSSRWTSCWRKTTNFYQRIWGKNVTREKLSMAKGKPQQTGMTAEINSIPLYAI
jgi:hypothetical protein